MYNGLVLQRRPRTIFSYTVQYCGMLVRYAVGFASGWGRGIFLEHRSTSGDHGESFLHPLWRLAQSFPHLGLWIFQFRMLMNIIVPCELGTWAQVGIDVPGRGNMREVAFLMLTARQYFFFAVVSCPWPLIRPAGQFCPSLRILGQRYQFYASSQRASL